VANKESRNQQVRLSYDEQGKSFLLGDGHDEIQRIITDLNKISQIKSPHMNMRNQPEPPTWNSPTNPGGNSMTQSSNVLPIYQAHRHHTQQLV